MDLRTPELVAVLVADRQRQLHASAGRPGGRLPWRPRHRPRTLRHLASALFHRTNHQAQGATP